MKNARRFISNSTKCNYQAVFGWIDQPQNYLYNSSIHLTKILYRWNYDLCMVESPMPFLIAFQYTRETKHIFHKILKIVAFPKMSWTQYDIFFIVFFLAIQRAKSVTQDEY